MTNKHSKDRPRNPMPERIEASPSKVARVILNAPRKKQSEWRYLKKGK